MEGVVNEIALRVGILLEIVSLCTVFGKNWRRQKIGGGVKALRSYRGHVMTSQTDRQFFLANSAYRYCPSASESGVKNSLGTPISGIVRLLDFVYLGCAAPPLLSAQSRRMRLLRPL